MNCISGFVAGPRTLTNQVGGDGYIEDPSPNQTNITVMMKLYLDNGYNAWPLAPELITVRIMAIRLDLTRTSSAHETTMTVNSPLTLNKRKRSLKIKLTTHLPSTLSERKYRILFGTTKSPWVFASVGPGKRISQKNRTYQPKSCANMKQDVGKRRVGKERKGSKRK